MTRTVMTSIARTCPVCRATNTVVAATTEITPSWPMNCSRCGAPLGQHEAPRSEGRQDARGGQGAAGLPAAVRPAERRGAGRGARRRRRLSRCCSGLQVAAGAALGVICTMALLAVPGAPDRPGAGADGSMLATAPIRAPAVPEAAPLAPPAPMRPAGSGVGAWEAAMEAALEVELARLEAVAVHVADRNPHADLLGLPGAPIDLESAARAEAALALSRRDRRELQRRLVLAEHDPRLVDGIFGPATRAAIAGWQGAAGLPPTGYFDERALALLEEQTEERFRAWQTAESKRSRGRRTQTAGLGSNSAAAEGGARCQRTWSGEIAYGRTVLCDFHGLRENVAQLFRASERS